MEKGELNYSEREYFLNQYGENQHYLTMAKKGKAMK